MTTLPPLPEPAMKFDLGHGAYKYEQMTAYGQACRNAALEEAAKVCEAQSITEYGDYQYGFQGWVSRCVDAIRGFK